MSVSSDLKSSLPVIAASDLKLGEVIGQGGYGTVYEATWNHKKVAVKKLQLQKLDAELLNDFKQEAEVMGQCRFENIVNLFGICLELGHYSLVMEYLPKGSLRKVLKNKVEVLPWNPLRWQIATEIGIGLTYLHNQKIFHRDLKSLNILLDKDYHAKISDFGLAKLKLETNSTTGTAAKGTVRWKAPELFKRGAKANEASDIYSYGMILWEIASRQLPYSEAMDEVTVMGWINAGEKENIPADTPKHYAQVIEACWGEPQTRPPASKVVEMLKQAIPTLESPSQKSLSEKSWHYDAAQALLRYQVELEDESSSVPLPISSNQQAEMNLHPKIFDKTATLNELKEIPIKEFLEAIFYQPKNAVPYVNLRRMMGMQEISKTTLLDGQTMTQQQLCLKAIALDPSYSRAYSALGAMLSSSGSITLLDGTKMTQQQLFLKAIALEHNFDAYYNLGTTLASGGGIALLDGTKMTQQQLFLKAIALDPNNSWACNNLGTTLASGGSIALLDGTKMTNQQLYLKAIALDPNNSSAYNNLGTTLASSGSIALLDGTKMTKQQLFLKAIALEHKFDAYYNLGTTLASGGSIALLDGTKMTQQQLYLKAIALNPNFSMAYHNLGTTLSSGGSITLLDGTKMTQQQLFLKAIALDPNYSMAYHNLGTTLSSGGSITLLDGTKMTQQQLYLKAIALDPNYSMAYHNLGLTLSSGQKIKLYNGEVVTKEWLMEKS